MKICAAQTRPVPGDIQSNIEQHKKVARLAISQQADLLFFPELSLTGYEPTLAKQLAMDPQDERLSDFETLSEENNLTIGIGIPLKCNDDTCISMVIFQPKQNRQVYSKKYLHADEKPFFTSGTNEIDYLRRYPNIAPAICYEISVPEHAAIASKNGATIYLASVAKTAAGVEKAVASLAAIAKQYSMMVIMSNCIGLCDGEIGGGKSAAWNNKGLLIDQLNDTDEGILILDTETAAATSIHF